MSIRRTLKTLGVLAIAALMTMPVQGAIISRIYNFTDGSILTASQLNTEFNNLVDGVNSLDATNLVANANILPAQLNATIAGDGLGRNSTTGVLSVNVDDIGIEVSGDDLQLKDLGVVTAKINDLAVTTGKINALAVTDGKIAAATITADKLDTGFLDNSTLENASGTVHVKSGGITGTQVTSSVNLPGNTVKENGQNVIVSSTNAGTSSLKVIRGIVNSSRAAAGGEGFSVSAGATGYSTVTFTSAFLDTPVVTISPVAGIVRVAVIDSVSTSSVTVHTMATDSTDTNVGYHFIAIGQR